MKRLDTIPTTGERIPAAPVTPPPAVIVLEMREEVAETLKLLVGRVSGPLSGRRGHTSELYDALSRAGVRSISSHHSTHPDVVQPHTPSATIITFTGTVTS